MIYASSSFYIYICNHKLIFPKLNLHITLTKSKLISCFLPKHETISSLAHMTTVTWDRNWNKVSLERKHAEKTIHRDAGGLESLDSCSRSYQLVVLSMPVACKLSWDSSLYQTLELSWWQCAFGARHTSCMHNEAWEWLMMFSGETSAGFI